MSSPSISLPEACAACGAKGIQLRHVTRSFGRENNLMVIEGIPLWSCPHCGASYFTAETLHEIEHLKADRHSRAIVRLIPVAIFPPPPPPHSHRDAA